MSQQVVQGPITDRVRPYEFVRDVGVQQLYTRTTGTIKNASGVAILAGAIQCGFPVKKVGSQWTVVNAGDEANATGFFLGDDSFSIPEALANNAITAYKYMILFRGPVMFNQAMIPVNDLAGNPYTVATLVTAFLALSPPIDSFVELPAAAVQST